MRLHMGILKLEISKEELEKIGEERKASLHCSSIYPVDEDSALGVFVMAANLMPLKKQH